jgi:putative methyltransferase
LDASLLQENIWRRCAAAMSLYYEAAAILANAENTGGSLKSRLFTKKDLKSSPGQIFALIAESSKWSIVLKDVIEKTGVLAEEKKVRKHLALDLCQCRSQFLLVGISQHILTRIQLTPLLALLLTHDLLIAKGGVAAAANHVLKLAITRHKARLSAEFTKARIRHGHATLAAFKEAVSNGALEDDDDDQAIRHPRWVRVNAIKTTLEAQLKTTFAGFTKVESLAEVLAARGTAKVYYEDPNIPNLLALPSRISLGRSEAYTKGQIIFQDKASCFPAYLLNLSADDGDVIDGCAAPGNKTTHLAAIVSTNSSEGQKVIAFERDEKRTTTLHKMVKLASADKIVSIKGASDFLSAKPHSNEFANIGAIVLDPSCSGTGIVGRDDGIKIHLPVSNPVATGAQKATKGKKRKRGDEKEDAPEPATLDVDMDDTTPEETPVEDKLTERLDTLSNFQLHILTHAMRFASAHKITYSTCSIHFEENEGVVFQALASSIANKRGWKILKREHQVDGMKKWNRRGVWEDEKLERDVDEEQKQQVLDACIRCDKGTEEGTMGFFVAAFVREDNEDSTGVAPVESAPADEMEWEGFSDGGEAKDGDAVPKADDGEVSKKSRKKKKRKTNKS